MISYTNKPFQWLIHQSSNFWQWNFVISATDWMLSNGMMATKMSNKVCHRLIVTGHSFLATWQNDQRVIQWMVNQSLCHNVTQWRMVNWPLIITIIVLKITFFHIHGVIVVQVNCRNEEMFSTWLFLAPGLAQRSVDIHFASWISIMSWNLSS